MGRAPSTGSGQAPGPGARRAAGPASAPSPRPSGFRPLAWARRASARALAAALALLLGAGAALAHDTGAEGHVHLVLGMDLSGDDRAHHPEGTAEPGPGHGQITLRWTKPATGPTDNCESWRVHGAKNLGENDLLPHSPLGLQRPACGDIDGTHSITLSDLDTGVFWTVGVDLVRRVGTNSLGGDIAQARLMAKDAQAPAPLAMGGLTVNGRTLTVAFNELLDTAHKPDKGANNFGFTVAGGNAPVPTVTAIAFRTGDTSKLDLTLSRAVQQGETGITLDYDAPSDDMKKLQDAAGNKVDEFPTPKAVANVTRAPAVATGGLTVDRSTLTLAFDRALDTAHLPDRGSNNWGFTVSDANNPDTANPTTVTAIGFKTGDARKLELTLSRSFVHSDTATITLTYAPPADDAKKLQDAVGSQVLAFTDKEVTNVTAFAPPGLWSYEAETGPGAGQFTVSWVSSPPPAVRWWVRAKGPRTGGAFRDVTECSAVPALDPPSSPFNDTRDRCTAGHVKVGGRTVALKPGEPYAVKLILESATGDRLEQDVPTRTGENTVAAAGSSPSGGSVNGTALTLAFNQALDTGSTPANAAFTVTARRAGASRTIRGAAAGSVSVGAAGREVTVTLAQPVAHGEAVTASYTPGANGLRAAAASPGLGLAVRAFTGEAVTLNLTPRAGDEAGGGFTSLLQGGTTSPHMPTGRAGSGPGEGEITLLWQPAATGTAPVRWRVYYARHGSSSIVEATGHPRSPLAADARSYTISGLVPGAAYDVRLRAEGQNGTLAYYLVEAKNVLAGPDVTAPALAAESPLTVNGDTLTLAFDDALDVTRATNPLHFDVGIAERAVYTRITALQYKPGDATRVELTLSPPVRHGDTVTLSYGRRHDPNPLQDAAGNRVADFAARPVTNETPAAAADTTGPTPVRAERLGEWVTVFFDEPLDESSLPDRNRINASTRLPDQTTNLYLGSAVTVTGARARVRFAGMPGNEPIWQIGYVAGQPPLQDKAGNPVAGDFTLGLSQITDTTPAAGSRPWVTDVALVSSPGADGLYGAGEWVRVQLTFSERVDLHRHLGKGEGRWRRTRVLIRPGPDTGTRWALYESGEGTKQLVFSYLLNDTDLRPAGTQPAGIAVVENSLLVEDGRIYRAGAPLRWGTAAQDTWASGAHFGLPPDPNHRVGNVGTGSDDTTAPVLRGATVLGSLLTLSFDEALAAASVPGSALTVRIAVQGETERALPANAVTVTGNRAVAALHHAPPHGAAVTVTYTPPADAAQRLKDTAGNAVGTLENIAVRNTTPEPEPLPALRPGEKDFAAHGDPPAGAPGAPVLARARPGPGAGRITVEWRDGASGAAVAGWTVRARAQGTSGDFVDLAGCAMPGSARRCTSAGFADADGTALVAGRAYELELELRAASGDKRTLRVQNVTAKADRTRPAFFSASVDGPTVTVTFSEALDTAHKPASGRFTVTGGDAPRPAVTAVAFREGDAAQIELTLSRAAAEGETGFMLRYTLPGAATRLQDAAGNPVAAFTEAVGNDTTVLSLGDLDFETEGTPPDGAPDLPLAATARPGPGEGRITVRWRAAAGGAAVTGWTVGARAHGSTTGAFALLAGCDMPGSARRCTSAGYADGTALVPGEAYDLELTLSAGSATHTLRAENVTAKPDTTAPAFWGASVDGPTLTVTFSEPLDRAHKPDKGNNNFGFTVTGGDASKPRLTVTAVAFDADDPARLALTLSRAAAEDETGFRLRYAVPGTAAKRLQDAAGNPVAAFTEAVSNDTNALSRGDLDFATHGAPPAGAPDLPLAATARPGPGEGRITVRWREAAGGAPVTGWTVGARAHGSTTGAFALLAGCDMPGSARRCTSAGYAGGTALVPGEAYDLELKLNAGSATHTLRAENVTAKPDTTAPAFFGASVDGPTLTVTFSEALDSGHKPDKGSNNFGFTVTGGDPFKETPTVTAIAFDADDPARLKLTLSRAAAEDETGFRLRYARPGTAAKRLQDAAGNPVAAFTEAVSNDTNALSMGDLDFATHPAGTTPPAGAPDLPLAATARPGPGEGRITVAWREAASGAAVTGWTVGARAHGTTGAFALLAGCDMPGSARRCTSAGYAGGTALVPGQAYDLELKLKAGSATHTLRAENVTALADTTAPTFVGASVDLKTLTVRFSEPLDTDHVPPAANFPIAGGNAPRPTVTAVAFRAGDATELELTLSRTMAAGENLTLGYNLPVQAQQLQDAAGNAVLRFSGKAVARETGRAREGTAVTDVAIIGNPQAGSPFAPASATVRQGPGAGELTVDWKPSTDAASPAVYNWSVAIRPAGVIAPVCSRNFDILGGNRLHPPRTFSSSSEDCTGELTPGGSYRVDLTLSSRDAENVPKSRRLAWDVVVPTGTIPPAYAGAELSGATLTLTFDRALDTTHVPGAAQFPLAGGDAPMPRVTAVAFKAGDATKTKLELTLSRSTTRGEVLRVGYRRPGTAGQRLQDAAGVEVAEFSDKRVTSATPTPTPAAGVMDFEHFSADDPAPGMPASATVRPGPGHGQFTVAWTEGPAPAVAIWKVTARRQGTTGTLEGVAGCGAGTAESPYMAPPVRSCVATDLTPGQAYDVFLTMLEVFTGERILRAQNVVALDARAPAYAGAALSGSTLTVTFDGALDTDHVPGAAAFALAGGDAPMPTVTAVAFDEDDAKKLELTLSRATVRGEVLRLGYRRPGAATRLQDAAGNPVAPFSDKAVTSETPAAGAMDFTPHHADAHGQTPGMPDSATVRPGPREGQITVAWTGTPNPAVTTWSVVVFKEGTDGPLELVNGCKGVAATQRSCVGTDLIPGQAYQVRLWLVGPPPVFPRRELAARNIVAPDATAPAYVGAELSGATLTLTFDEALDTDHVPGVGQFPLAGGDAPMPTVTRVGFKPGDATRLELTLSRSTVRGEVLRLGYRRPGAATRLQDAAGHAVAAFSNKAVTSETPFAGVMDFEHFSADDPAPGMPASATVRPGPGHGQFTVAWTEGPAPAVAIWKVTARRQGTTGTLEGVAGCGAGTAESPYMAPPVRSCVATDLTPGQAYDVFLTMLEVFTGERILRAQNVVALDARAPAYAGAALSGSTLTVTFDGALDTDHVPGAAAFALAGGDAPMPTVTAVAFDEDDAKKLELTLSRATVRGEVLRLGYRRPGAATRLQDAAGHAVAAFSNKAVTSETPFAGVMDFEHFSADDPAPGMPASATVRPGPGHGQFTVAWTEGPAPAVAIWKVTARRQGTTGTLEGVAGCGAGTAESPYMAPPVRSCVATDLTPGQAYDVFLTMLEIFTGERILRAQNVVVPGPEWSAPTVESVAIVSDPRDGIYALGDVVRVRVRFDEAVAVTAGPGGEKPRIKLDLGLDPATRLHEGWAEYESGSGTTDLVFAMGVHPPGDQHQKWIARPFHAVRGIAILPNTLHLQDRAASIRAVAAPNNDAALGHAGTAHDPGHMVDVHRPMGLGGSFDGKVVTYTFDEALNESSVPRNEAFTVFQSGWGLNRGRQVKPRRVEVADNTVRLILEGPPVIVENFGSPHILLAYNSYPHTASLRGHEAQLTDRSGNRVLSFSNRWLTPLGQGGVVISRAQAFGGQELVFGVVLSQPAAARGTATYRTADGTAEAGTDYVAASGTLTFEAGETAKTVRVRTLSNPVPSGGLTRKTMRLHVTSDTLAVVTRDRSQEGMIRQAEAAGAAIISDPGADLTYGRGDTVRVRLLFDRSVDVAGGTPRLKLKLAPDGGGKWANYESGSGTAELVFAWGPVAAPDLSTQGIAVVANSLEANGGTLRLAGTQVDAPLGHAGLGHDPNHKVDHRLSAAPVVQVAAVGTKSLAFLFDRALDRASLPAGSAFTVTVTPAGGGAARAIAGTGTARLDGSGRVLRVTLAEAVVHGETVTAAYAVPAENPIRDPAGNTVAAFSGQAAQNQTSASVLVDAAVSGAALTLAFSGALDAGKLPAGSAFTVTATPSGGGAARAIAGTGTVGIDGTGRTLLVALAGAVAHGETATVAYLAPARNMLLDPAGNAVSNFSGAAVRNDTPDLPVLAQAAVNGTALTLVFDRALDTAAAPIGLAFAVTVTDAEGVLRTLVGNGRAAFGAADGKVSVTLSGAVAYGETATVAYTVPAENPLRGAAGEAVAAFSGAAVRNDAPGPPALAEAAVNGAALTLVFDRALDTGSAPAGTAFAVSATDAAGVSRTIAGTGTAAFGEADGAVSVTLAQAVAHGETATVAYTVPDDNPLQSAAGDPVAAFAGAAVENLTGGDAPAAVASVALTSTPGIDADGDGSPDTYGRGETVEVTLTWDADVTWDLSATGAGMRVRLDVGGETRAAELVTDGETAGTARSLSFRYETHRTDRAADGVFPTPAADGNLVVLRGGATLEGAGGRNAQRTHAALAADPLHKVDGARERTQTEGPRLTGVALASTPGIDADGDGNADTYGRGETVEVTLTWDADVIWDLSASGAGMRVRLDVGGENRAAELATGGETAGTARSLSFRYVTHRTDRAPDGVFPTPAADGNLVVLRGGATLEGAGGRHAQRTHAALAADPLHKVDGARHREQTEGPQLTGVALTSTPATDADGDGDADTYGRGETVEVTLTWDADVIWDLSAPGAGMRVRLDVGGTTRGANLATGGATAGTARSLAFRYETHRTDRAPDGVFPAPAASGAMLVLRGGATLVDGDGRAAALHHAALEPDPAHRVDGARNASAPQPAVRSAALVSDPGPHGVYGRDDVIRAALTFSETVHVDTAGGTPSVLLRFGRDPSSPTKTAAYESGGGTDTLVFAFGPVAYPDHSSHGVALVAHTLALGGGTIRSVDSLQDAALAHPGLDHDAGHRIDSLPPLVDRAAVDAGVLTVVFAEYLDPDAPPSGSAFTVTAVDGGGAARRIDGTGTATVDGGVVTVALASEVRFGETLRAHYDPHGVDPARDLAGNPATASQELAAENLTPRPNRPATGAPVITGVAQVGETLSASADGIADPDGMTSAVLAWQWTSNGGGADEDIAGATASTYELVEADEGRTLRVRVSFTDDAGFAETLVSAPTGPVAARPLTAAFEDVPAEHGGRHAAFEFTLVFSENFPGRFDYNALKDAFVVENGRVVEAKRAAQGQNQRWTITVRPWSHEAVTVTLPAGSVVTAAGRALANTVTATVVGPPALSVADARASEGVDEAVAFRVSLSRAAPGTVTVDYATRDGTAVAGEDYTATQGTLEFAPGELEKTVSVPILDDALDEGEETFLLRLSNAQGAAVADGEATGTIENSDPLQKMWLSRFGRTVAGHVTEAVSGRLASPLSGAEVTVGGQTVDLRRTKDEAWLGETMLSFARLLGASEEPEPEGDGWLGWGPGGGEPPVHSGSTARAVSGRELLLGSAFHLAREGDGGAPGLAAWGRVTTGGFDGEAPAETGNVRIDGEVTSGILGADAEWSRLLAGVAVSVSEGEGTFSQPGVDSGTIESTMTTVSPYARFMVNDRLSAWGLLGHGTGDMTIVQAANDRGQPERVTDTDLAMRLAALGGRGALLTQDETGGIDLALKADAFWVETESEAVSNEGATTGAASRARLILEGARAFTLGAGATLRPSLEAGLRLDGGDAETGAGVELGGGVAFADPSSRLSVEARARMLAAHADSDYEEWGVSGSVRLEPGERGRGLSFSLSPTLGQSSSAAERLWGARDAAELAPGGGFESERRLDAELGYGLAGPHGLGTVTPYAGLGLSGDDARTWRAGARWRIGPDASLDLEGTRSEAGAGAESGQSLMLRGTLRW